MGVENDDETCLYTLEFADCQMICANEKEELEYMTRNLKEEYEKQGLIMNIEKHKNTDKQYLCVGEEITAVSYTHLDVYKRQT